MHIPHTVHPYTLHPNQPHVLNRKLIIQTRVSHILMEFGITTFVSHQMDVKLSGVTSNG